MKHLNKKILSCFIFVLFCLGVFVVFCKTGVLFSTRDNDVITVSIKKQEMDTSKFVASATIVNEDIKEVNKTETTTTITETTTTTMVTKAAVITTTTKNTSVAVNDWTGPVLSKSKGVVYGPSGKETYYNLNMNSVVSAMRNMGFNEQDYPYWVRDDGVKMLGSYVIVAANYNIRPKGSIIQTSLGNAIVCDTGGFAQSNPTQVDIAVTW